MKEYFKRLSHWSSILLIIVGTAFLMAFELLDDPDITLGQMLIELIQPALIVTIAVGMVRLTEHEHAHHEKQMLLIADLEAARAEGMQWRNGMKDLINGLSRGIASQFSQWNLTPAECDVGLLILKGMSYKEIAFIRDVSEKTIRQQAHTLYRKAKLSGRAALSAFFLEDLLLPDMPPDA